MTLLTRCLREPKAPRTDCVPPLLSICVSCQMGWASARPILCCCDSFVVSHGWASARRNLIWQGFGSPHAPALRERLAHPPNHIGVPKVVVPNVVGSVLVHLFVRDVLEYAGFECSVGWAIARLQIWAERSLAHPCSFRFRMGLPWQGRCSSPYCPSLWQGPGSPVCMAGLRLALFGWASSSPVRVGQG